MKKTFSIAATLALVLPFVASANLISSDAYEKLGFGDGIMLITWAVWLLVGILAVIWLWKQINAKG